MITMLLNWLVPQSGGLPFKYWLFHKMIFFQTSSLPRRMLKKFWFTEFRQADPVLFFLTFQVLKYFQTSTINPWRLWNSSFIHRPNLLPLEGEIWCNNSLLVLAVFIVEHWLWIEDKRLIWIYVTAQIIFINLSRSLLTDEVFIKLIGKNDLIRY